MTLPMSPAEREEWKRIRASGVYRFIVEKGVLRFGGGMLLLSMAALRRIEPADYFARFVLGRPVELIIALGGACWAIVMWIINENRFKTSAPGTEA